MESKSFSFWKYLPKAEALELQKIFVMESKSFSFWKYLPKAEALELQKIFVSPKALAFGNICLKLKL